MILYLQMPAPSVLVAYAFEKYPDIKTLVLWSGHGELAEVHDYVHPQRESGTTMNFGIDYLWDLRKADQAKYEDAHKHEQLEYV